MIGQGGTLRDDENSKRGTLRDIELNRRDGASGGFLSDNQTGTVFIRVSIPELKVQKCLQFELDETVWEAKQRILQSFSKDLRDSLNYGLYMPPMNGRAGKFLDEERLLREYPLHGPIGFLEFKYKRRVYKLIHLNPRKLKQLHNKTNYRQFFEHVKNGNLSKINKMASKGLDPNFHDHTTGETPLTYAVQLPKEKCREIIISLVSGGAHLDFRTKQGQTAIHKAVLNGNQEALKSLLDLGASTNYKDSRGLTPLYYSVLYGKNANCTEMLLHERAQLGVQDENGWYEIHQACRTGLVQHLEHLMFYGADMDVQNASGNTPLHICAVNNMEQCARVLLFRGANKTIENYNSQTAHQVAIIAGNMALAEIIKLHDSKDIVPFREMPSFSDRRKTMYSSTFSLMSRSRSDPKINFVGTMDSHASSQPPSMRSLPQHYQMYSDSGSYPASRSSDSPRSMSISSSSSGPGATRHWNGSTLPSPSSYIEEISPEISPLLRRHTLLDRDNPKSPWQHHNLTNRLSLPADAFSSAQSSTEIDFEELQMDDVFYLADDDGDDEVSESVDYFTEEGQNTVKRADKYRQSQPAVSFSGVELEPGFNDRKFVCIHPYEPSHPLGLSLDYGDIVQVASVSDTGYWEGSVGEREGWFPAEHVQEVRLRHKAGSLGDLLGESRESTLLNRNTLAALIKSDNSEYAPRTVVLQRASEGYGFVLRGAKSQLKPNGELDFRPTAEFPALQYLDSIDPGSAADRAGLKPGDFILEINGENVVRASHDRVVNLIRGTGDTLAMKVVTVRAGSRSQDWFNQNSYSSTMPNRKKKAPQPPQRDPRTSLSFSRSEGQSVSEELAIMEKLDQAILERKTSGEEKKTASIRSKLAAKRVSSVELENIGVNPNQETKIGPNGYLERSRSQPNLVDGNVKHIYAVPNVNQAMTASVIVNDPGVRPKGPPPQPPGGESQGRKQAPKPPVQNIPPKSEVVTIDTRKSSPYASSKIAVGNENAKTESVYESSFRPGISAKLSDEPPVSEQSKLKSSLHHETSAGVNVKSNTTVIHTGDDPEKPSVSFAEDKVFDNAATFLKKHPNAKLLVTAEVHNKMKNRNSSVYEPEPDYDQEDSGEEVHNEPSSPVKLRENRQSVTVISIGEKEKQKESNTLKRYTIHSTIPAEEQKTTGNIIPPRPEGPAPIPPANKSSQFNREIHTDQSSRISVAKSVAPAPPKEDKPPPLPPTPPPDMDLDEVDVGPAVAVASGPPAPAPPPPPPPPQTEELKKMPSFVKADYIAPIPKDDIASAVLKRQKRIEEEGLKVTAPKPKTFQDQKESNQAAILAAVANRRKQLEQVGENTVVESIESRLQRTKKLQAAKFNFASSKTTNKKETEKDDSKSNDASKSNSNTLEKSVKVVPKPLGKPEKETTAAKPHELSFKVKPSSPTTKSPTEPKPKTPGLTEIKPNFKVKTAPKTPVSTAIKTDKPKVEVKKIETIPKSVSTESENKDVISKNETNVNGKSDFLALAEKKRQELLQRKSQKSPAESKTNSARSSIANSPEKEKFQIKKNSPPTQLKPKSKFPVKGVTIDQSETEHQTMKSFVKGRSLNNMNGDVYTNDDTNNNESGVPPPPPGFRDGGIENTVVHLEIIPPPATFSSDIGVDLSHQHSPAFSPDTASLVSSLSTLSSLSGDQNEIRSANSGYDDLIAPPPPGFGDDESSTVIPPPPEFGTDKEKAFTRKSVETWLCNDVLDWLDSIKMSQYKKSFQSNCIDGKKLLELTRNDYLKLEVTQVSHRMNIERSIKKAAIKQNVGASDIIASERL